ncbi:TPA: flagellar basal body-associated FliL family protein [Candidatus Poribacteria bacterium]|jgi:flagellar basal body-associated protein FliL|nr:flagellar basal body-associated FliL family protein [Candidatus Poribacteria bacterium]HIA70590.1 flagellar basal body-associated FliL family protein [Candidatus Poribacteria bacterium]HIB90373.1 flagellar basal body-associated FliL family protein [Candidatus Poribacteria bacterium]HIC03890.1 flagellar basal body-associated FliL family protein [Candidatus Poribacteria bacterium]HIC19222.1 flagellar basal body-associated FliL family protein [Candidatus Poribacteria bacterium]
MSYAGFRSVILLVLLVGSVLLLAGCGGDGKISYGYYDLSDAVIVNYIDGEGNKGYVSLKLTVELPEGNVVTIGTMSQRIRHATVLYLKNLSSDELTNYIANDQEALADGIKDAMSEETKADNLAIERILFRDFVMQ